MQRKFFPFDKNYLLEQAQLEMKHELSLYLVEQVKQTYLLRYNPLGLIDKSIEKIVNTTEYSLVEVGELYEEMAGIYRYKFSSNQLELLFDGKDHLEKYKEDWTMAFKEWLFEFGKSKNFLKAVLEATIFYPEDKQAQLAYSRLRNFISEQFGLKVYKYKGIIPMKIA
ncbi:hypothetical protein GCM10027429_08520 [Marivirga atlantica]|jgi:hypothetical protein|uniref:Uncharacterized protein n=1 Tax=Marivirga atlantica TaxID=1548457 RepID=A0A937DDQ3_9BACT|nr:hypothetical protein [Marivirga atlantica]MBL0764462.1 hypothetical protein [Marivirga atlantica]